MMCFYIFFFSKDKENLDILIAEWEWVNREAGLKSFLSKKGDPDGEKLFLTQAKQWSKSSIFKQANEVTLLRMNP